ncbi:hypothetical protein HMI54_012278 [Coelomomyces lativittatus]|nr:hypothetical protein HMI56_003022 [Coelomomyces lativittatus]KAJ1515483.1 hypothetical protein HMI54_012278 [Coelomomyces lativittatus]KAJ1517340.1 hypothetical protein HMI55_007396 [Coelomomyces lativittatus]
MGIDKKHPAFECNRKKKCPIAKYRDYVTPKGAPMDSFSGHGTKVGGILVGQKSAYVGVAPEAKLFMYKIFGPQGEVTFTIFCQALEDAIVKDQVDILNLSFGTPDPWNLSNLTTVLESTVAQSKTIVVSVAGNQKGLFFSNAPGNSPYVLSVTSLNSPGILVRTMVVNGIPVEYMGSITHPLHPTYICPTVVVMDPFATSSFLCDTEDVFINSPYTLFRRTLVVYQGQCRSETISNIIKNALSVGAMSVLVAIHSNDLSDPQLLDEWRLTGWNWAKIKQKDAQDAFSRTPGVYDTVPMELNLIDVVRPHPNAGQLSWFASFGPMANYHLIKPDLAGFGKNVFVPVPTEKGTWGLEEGTSLTAPYVAGCIALIFQVKGKMPLPEVRSLLMTSAQPVFCEKGWAAPVHGQGAGLIQVDRALQQVTRLHPLSGLALTFEDLTYDTVVTLENMANTSLMYTLRHIPALAIQGLDTQVKMQLNVEFHPPNVYISPHQKRKVKVHFTSPSNAMVGTLFSGYLVMEPFSANLTKYPVVHYPYTVIRGRLHFPTMYSEVIRYTVNGTSTNTSSSNFGFPILSPGFSLEIGFQVTRPLRQFCILVYRIDQHNTLFRHWVGYLFKREYVFPGTYRAFMDSNTFVTKWAGSNLEFPGYYQLVTLGAFTELGEDQCDREWIKLPNEGIPGQILFLF